MFHLSISSRRCRYNSFSYFIVEFHQTKAFNVKKCYSTQYITQFMHCHVHTRQSFDNT